MGEPGNVQERDRVGIVEGSYWYRARGVSIWGKFVFSKNLGYKTNGVATWLNLVLNPKQRSATGVPGKLQGRHRVGFAEGSFGFRTRGVSIQRQFVLSRNMGYKTRGVAKVSKHSFDPPQAASRYGRAMQSSGTGSCRDCSRVLWEAGPWGQYSGIIRFIEKPGVQDDRGRHVAKRSSDPPAPIRHGRSRQSSGTGPCGDCRRVQWEPGPRDQYSG